MLRATFCVLSLTVAGGAAWAQSADGSPAFEVASIKPAAPQQAGRMMVMMRGGPETPDPGQLTYTNVSLKDMFTAAFGVKPYQVTGPAWLETERFDVVAKIPKGATKEQFKLMLQNLLAERFKMAAHHETKDLPMYALVVGKNGPKLKESVEESATDGATPGGPSAPPPPPPPPGPGTLARPTMGKDGFPQLPPGRKGTFMMFGQGRFRITANRETMSGLSDLLARQLGRPVTDMTDLKGKYDFTIEFAPDESMRMMGPMGGPPPMPKGEGGGDGGAPTASDQGPTIFTAIQELGLKLEQKKGPVDQVVIDRMEKTPTEN